MTITATKSAALAAFVIASLTFSTLAFASHDDSDFTESDAREAAEDAYTGDGEITDVELETEDGDHVYKIEFTDEDDNETEITVDAESGDIIEIDEDENDEEDDTDDENDDDMNDDDTATSSASESDDSGSDLLDLQARIITLLQQVLALLTARASTAGSIQ